MGLLSIEVTCDKCHETYGILVDRDERNTPQPCDKCDEGTASRVWSVPNVSTGKTSESIPDAVAAGRFDVLRRHRDAQREVSKAKAAYARNPSNTNKDTLKNARKEKKDMRDK